MIVGPGGENIYPEDIETVLNSHVYIADSIVTEQQGRLVALVHFNRDEIESMIDDWREEWTSKKEALEAKTEQLKKEILDFVNAKVNRFSRISEVVEEKDDFVKTPTHKIKRFLYSKKRFSGRGIFFALSATLFVGLRFAFLSIGVCAYSGLRFALRFAVSCLRSSPACRGLAIGRSLLRYRRSGTERSPRREARRVRLGSARSPYSGPRDPVRPLRGS